MFITLFLLSLVLCCKGQTTTLQTTTLQATTAEPPHEELFIFADKEVKDDRLDAKECRNFWLRFDGDNDHKVGKLEFELKWTFLDLNDAEHAAFFFRELDINLDGVVTLNEIARMCNYFDDDTDGYVSRLEFQMNWVALFTLPHGA